MNAAGYTRVSISEQAEDGFSLESQDHNIHAFAQGKGMEVVHIYQDAGISGTRSDRPALEQLLHDAEQGKFDVVIVHSIDRFYRDLQGLLKALNHLQQHGVAFISISENLDFTTPWGKLALAVLGSLAEIYIDRLSEDTRRGKRQRARNGLWNGSPPLGYCRGNCATCTVPNGPDYCPHAGQANRSQDKGLVLHPIESEMVRLAFEWYATGNYSDGQIAEKLSAHAHTLPDGSTVRFLSKGRPGRSDPGPLSKDTIRDVLKNPFYTGVVPYYGKQGPRRRKPVSLSPGKHQALVEQTVFDRCQEIRRLSARPRTHGGTTCRIYPLSGILYCAACGSKMRAQGGSKGRHYYVCTGRLQHTTDCSDPAVCAQDAEAQLVEFLDSLPVPDDLETWVCQQLDPEWDEQQVREQEVQLQGRLVRAVELYLAGDISKARYETEKTDCEDKLADLRPGAIRDILARTELLIGFAGRYQEASGLQKKKLMRVLVASAHLRKQCLVSVQPQPLLYPIFRNLIQRMSFSGGSDGI